MSTVPKPGKNTVTLKAPTVNEMTALVKKISELKVSVKVLMRRSQ